MIGVAYESFVKQMVTFQAIAEQRNQNMPVRQELLGWYNAERVYNCDQSELLRRGMLAPGPTLRRFRAWIRGVMAGFQRPKNPAQTMHEVSAWHGAEASGAVRAQR